MDNPSVVLVLTTLNSAEQANSLAHTLLAERLIACATILPSARSHYWWEGALVTEAEVVVLLKTQKSLLARLNQRVLELHPYKVPEFIAIEPIAISQAYAAWVQECTTLTSD